MKIVMVLDLAGTFGLQAVLKLHEWWVEKPASLSALSAEFLFPVWIHELIAISFRLYLLVVCIHL